MFDVDVNLLLIQLGVIFLPGIIWARLDASYAAKVKPTEVEFFLRAFIFGLIVYAVEFLLFTALDWPFTMADLADAGTHQVVTGKIISEVIWALGISLVLSVLWLYASTYKSLTRLLQKVKATKKFGDEDVWDFTLNSREAAVEYVHYRDYEHGLLYAGWVNTFSETDKLRELVLLDVIVYNLEGVEQYTMPRVYLARPPENMTIEFPYEKSGTEDDSNAQDGE